MSPGDNHMMLVDLGFRGKMQSINQEIRKTMNTRSKTISIFFLSLLSGLVALQAQATCITPPSGLISWWRAESNALDSVGSNDGTLINGAGFDTGEVGQAFTFSNNNQCVEIPYTNSFAVSNYTIEAWINPTAQPANLEHQGSIFTQNYGIAQFIVYGGSTGVYVALGFYDNYSGYHEIVSTNEIPLNQFSHVAASWDGTSLKVYINGALDGQTSSAYPPRDTQCSIFLGGIYKPGGAGYCYSNSRYFNGLIDETSFYNRALSQEEIAALYAAGSAGKCQP